MNHQNCTELFKTGCVISTPPLHLAQDATLSCPCRYVLFLTILCVQKGSEVRLNWPDVGQKCTLKACLRVDLCQWGVM